MLLVPRRQGQHNGGFSCGDVPVDCQNPHSLGQAAIWAPRAHGRPKMDQADDHRRGRRIRERTPPYVVADAAHFEQDGRDDGGKGWCHAAASLKRPFPLYGSPGVWYV